MKDERLKIESIMSKIYRNGNVVIRVSDIAAVSINDVDKKVVRVYIRANDTVIGFRCNTKQEAKVLLDEIQDIISLDGEPKRGEL